MGAPVLFDQGGRGARQARVRIPEVLHVSQRFGRSPGNRSQYGSVFGGEDGLCALETRPRDGAAHAREEDLLAEAIARRHVEPDRVFKQPLVVCPPIGWHRL